MPLYLLPLFPLVGFVLLICFGRLFRGALGGVIGTATVALSFVAALVNALNLTAPVHEVLWTWLPDMAGSLTQHANLPVGLYLDRLTALMTLIITGVGTLIHAYSIGYMKGDARFTRFFAFLNFFVAMMLILVMADSYPLMFVGWEGVGTASYLLIGFWFAGHRDAHPQEGVSNSNAARKAFIMNRVGDLGFMLGMFLIYRAYGTLVIPDLAAMGGALAQAGRNVTELICLFLLVGAVGKSGQLPLTTWLPDAMAGPTPVSALIHAATMVTAGVYLIARTHFLYDLAPTASTWVAWVGGLTALYGAVSALNQYDIKKILAYSTVSQLGYMFMAVGLHAYTAGVFHLLTHAFFKALLFLAAGAVIHALHEEQDVRRMGGLNRSMPFTHAVSAVGVLAISGIPIWSGFFSKDAILTAAFEHSAWLYLIGLSVALLTAFYMGRWYFLVWRGTYRGSAHPHEGGPVLNVPLGVLAALATLGGFLNVPAFLGGGHGLDTWLGAVLPLGAAELPTATEWGLTVTAVLAGVFGLGLAYALHRRAQLTDGPPALRAASLNSLYLDALYGSAVNAPAAALAGTLDTIDRGVDGTVEGIGMNVSAVGRAVTFWQSGFVRSYAVSMLLGTTVILGYWALKALGGLA
ncbi:NADH-quinone oxidoreductase subunit L [Deinococcus aquiradiocola]|uniref:NADH-quinone oxidoreductase subunit L n=1 Tax=Deinococcus aquiradiocola TaxID=393059 RepID=A0A917UJM5_9DEIO|nr:NADH-quinone oxidoreductase subunit L [Deinococcus aquiradiocola]GGJ62452.1 NADH-quinone oxidoreductase subunit L [Deinococcus aquiradiocola]